MADANIRAIITAQDRASKVLDGFGRRVESINQKIVSTAKVASVAFATAAAGAATFAIKSAANFEQTRIGLENMLGSADEARKMLKRISDFAAETPFEFPELAQAARQLVAFGMNAEDAYKTMKQLGNVSAAVGAPINDLAYLMGTLRAQGRAFTIDIRQFAQRGIPIYEELAKITGKNGEALQKMIEEGKIGFPEVQKAFENLAGEGGRWGKTMERQSKSVTGLFSTLKDTIGQTARELIGITEEGDIKEGSVFARLRDAVMHLNEKLPLLIEHLKEIVRGILPGLRDFGSNMVEAAKAAGDYLLPKLEALWHTIQDNLWPAIKDLVETIGPTVGKGLVGAAGLALDMLHGLIIFISDNTWVVTALAVAFGVVKTAMFLHGALQAFTTVMTGAVAVGTTSVATIKTAWGGLRAFIASPILMPAIGIAAALAAIAIVWNEYNKLIAAIEGANKSLKKFSEQVPDKKETYKRIRERSGQAAADRFWADQAPAHYNSKTEAQMREAWMAAKPRAAGGPISRGQPYLVGEEGPELVVPHESGTVVPSQRTASMMGGGTVNLNVNIGMYAGTEMEKRRMAESILNALKDVAQSKNTTLTQMMGR